jgi:hypothetical protein
MFLKLASGFSNFFWAELKSALPALASRRSKRLQLGDHWYFYDLRRVMDLVIAVVLGNLTISIVILVITIWTIRFRKQVVALTDCFERWDNDCHLLMRNAPSSLAASRVQIDYLRQIYQQQLVTLDRIRALGLFWGVARSLVLKRRRVV